MSSSFIDRGELKYVPSEEYPSLDVKGTDLETIINEGYCLANRQEFHISIYQYKDKLFFYAGIDGVRFRKQVKPGDRFDMEAELVKLKGPIAKAHAKGFVDGQLAVEADLMFSIVGNK